MTLVFQEQVVGPAATHALVIGVGSYPHLVGGAGPVLPNHEGMGQLTSAPISARDFAFWLIDKYENPKKELATVELLLSDAQSSDFLLPRGQVVQVQRARMGAVSDAVLDWKRRGDGAAENLLIFFFCGHGMGREDGVSLLLEDYGEVLENPLKGAIAFLPGLYGGMNKCQARQQCYFIDACRTYSRELIESWSYGGDPIIPGKASDQAPGGRRAPIYYSTVAGSSSYGVSNTRSVFTEALLKSLAGAGSDDCEGGWRIYTDRLNIGISHLVERTVGPAGLLDQVASTANLAQFTLHYLDGPPLVPVTVTCGSAAANRLADLCYYRPGKPRVPREEKVESDWYPDIPKGTYRFAAAFPQGGYHDNEVKRPVRPAYKVIPIEV
jgi:hypothetical protein